MAKGKDLGGTLRKLREAHGLGIKTVGRELNVSYSYLSKVENGHKSPSTDLVQKLSELYRVDPEEMLAKVAELPPDIQQIIQEKGKEVFDLLRKTYAHRTTRDKNKKSE
jgi:transcriptional regulator with XRE-family HTH domain